MKTINKHEHWLSYIDGKRRKNLVLILQELSRLLNTDNPQFVIIGAMSLLMQGAIRGYKVLWDVDLLFKNANAILDFIAGKKTENLRIVQMENEIVQNKNIGSIHTLWSFDKTWFNVDYIIKGGLFDFYNPLKRKNHPFHTEMVQFENRDYRIELLLADFTDIFIEKMVFPRMQKQLDQKDDLGVDIRHCLYMLHNFGKKDWFWEKIKATSMDTNNRDMLKQNLIRLIEIKDELGYSDTTLPNNIYKRIRSL